MRKNVARNLGSWAGITPQEVVDMAQLIRDIMTQSPITLPSTHSIASAARAMRDSDIGSVIVEKDGKVCGILSDRDIVVRAIAMDRDPASTPIGDLCSDQLATLSPTDQADHAATLMRKKAIRRIPIVEDGKAVGILSLGDLAVNRDPRSVLGGISAAASNG